ncbi:MAG TPA: hypothetical protein PK087_00530 [Bacilli bacterium]|nr:MAG: Chromosome partition protein Smc [Tenericutes bacterium ADurb.BinA124]HOH17783.1 hypothetical protein [Bacilli bacterium]HPX83810.1 hypothetical protein [Bacilli bacterium]HQC74253.1 hypothetical protein [Bacilli bacterium]
METNPKKTPVSSPKKRSVKSGETKKTVVPVEEKPVDVVERLKNVLAEVQENKEKPVPKKAAPVKKKEPAKKKTTKASSKTTAKKPASAKKKSEAKKRPTASLEELNVKSKKPLPISKKSEQTPSVTSDVERLKGVISAGKRLQQLMEIKELKTESKERVLKEKISLAQGLEEDLDEVTFDELEQEQSKVQELNEKIALLQAEKEKLDAAISKVMAAKVSGIPIIDEESLDLSPSFPSGVPANQQEETSPTSKKISEIEEVLISLEKQHAENQIKLMAAEQANKGLMDQYGEQAVVVNDLEKEVVALRGEVLNEQATNQQIKDQLEIELQAKEQYQKEAEELKKQLDLSKAKFPTLKAALIEEMDDKIAIVEQRFLNVKKEGTRLKRELQSLTKSVEKAQAKEELAKNKMLEEKKEKQTLAKEVASLKSNIAKMEASAETQMQKQQAVLQEAKETKQAQTALKREITRLEKAVETQKTKEQQTRALLQDEKKANRRLQKDLDNLQIAFEKEKEKAIPTEKIVAIDQAFQDEKKENARLQKSLNSLTDSFEKLKAQKGTKKAELDAVKKEAARLNKDNEALKATFDDLKNKSLENKKLYDAEKKLTAKLEKRLENLTKSKKELQTTIRYFKKQEQAQLEKDAQKDQLIEAKKAEKEQVEKQLEQLRQEVDGMMANLQTLHQTNETLKSRDYEENSLFEEENQQLRSDKQKIAEENNRLYDVIEDLRKTNDQLKNHNLELTKRLETELGSLNQSLNSQAQENTALLAQLNTLENEKAQLEAELKEQMLRISETDEQDLPETKQLKDANQQLIAANNDLNLALELLKTKYADLEKVLEKERLEKSQMLPSKDDSSKVAGLINELNRTQDLVKAKDLEVEILKSALFREQNRVVSPEPYPFYNYDHQRYQQNILYQQPVEPKIAPGLVEQQEKQSLVEEIKALKAEIDKLKQTPSVDSQALLNEFREELLRNREELSRMNVQKEQEIQAIAENYETRLQSTEQEKVELKEQNNQRLQQISDLQTQVDDKEYTLQRLKTTVKQFTEEDIFDPEFKRRIRLIRDMQKEIKNRLDEEAINYNSSMASLELKISQRQEDIDKLNSRINQLTATFNANRDFTASTKEAFEKAKAKALLELQLQEERLGGLEEDQAHLKTKYQNFVSAKEQELTNLKIKEGQIIDYYLRKIRQDYALTDDYKEIKQVESERNQLLTQIQELKASQEQTTETIVKQSEEISKVVAANQKLSAQLQDERKVAIDKQAGLLEAELREQGRELGEITRKMSDLKTELDKRLEYEKHLRINEEKVSDFFNNKILLEQCLTDFNARASQMTEVTARIESLGTEPANRTELLKAKAELTDLEVHRDDLRSKIDFCRKNLKDLETNATVATYMKLINQIDQIRNAQKELREKAELLKDSIQVKNKELDALMKEKAEIV